MNRKRKKSGFFIKLGLLLAILVAVFCGAYFAIDKLLVPKYFKAYGIENMHDLVSVVKTLYTDPKEKEIIENGFTPVDKSSAVNKLLEIGFPESSTGGEIDYAKVSDAIGFDIKPGKYTFTDRQVASIVDDMLNDGVLASKLPDLEYINTMNIKILDLIITPTLTSQSGGQYVYAKDKADIKLTFKFDTSTIKAQMAKEMETPSFLLDMVIPKSIYLTCNYSLRMNDQEEWVIFGDCAVNGRDAEDSRILLNLLIDFIFPEEDQMTIDKLTQVCGDIILQGIGLLGDIEFQANIDGFGSNGVILTME